MITVTKTIRFDAAHILTNHQWLCKNLHGHTYRVDVSVTQGDGDTSDMVIDFKDLKRIASEVVCERFDHAFIYNTESEGEREIAAVVEFRDDPHHLFELELRERIVEPVVEVGDHLHGRREERDAANLVAHLSCFGL